MPQSLTSELVKGLSSLALDGGSLRLGLEGATCAHLCPIGNCPGMTLLLGLSKLLGKVLLLTTLHP